MTINQSNLENNESIEANLNTETKSFDANIEQLLQLFISSIYTNQEIFLRELLSNSSDALDKLKFMQLTSKATDNGPLKIVVSSNKETKTITILDNGIGMNKEDMMNHLGVIAKSGTKEFLEKELSKSKDKNTNNLIGQFGVGFYSAFMVADKVEVISKKANEDKTFIWSSYGKSSYDISEYVNNNSSLSSSNNEVIDANNTENTDTTSVNDISANNKIDSNLEIKESGTKIILHIKESSSEFLDHFRLKNIVKTYSDNILYPIYYFDVFSNTENKINSTVALWTKSRNEIKAEEYNEFYKNIAHDGENPIAILHNVNEGTNVEFTNLLFIPAKRPHDAFHPDRVSKVKLYIKRVFITDQNAEIVPKYLRFLRGIIDCASLPLNISREILQNNSTLFLIKDIVEKKVLSKLKDIKKQDFDLYQKFWTNFGAILKEGLCDYGTSHKNILETCIFYSVKENKMISLDEYIDNISKYHAINIQKNVLESEINNSNTNENISEDKKELEDKYKNIYFLIAEEGDSQEYLKQSSHVEKLLQEGKDVLIMRDSVDSFWTTVVSSYKDFTFASATARNQDSDDSKTTTNELCKYFEAVLSEYNVEVKLSNNLINTSARLIDSGMTKMHMEKFLFKNNQLNKFGKKVMEINENHSEIVKIQNSIAENKSNEVRESLIKVLFFNACIMEDYPIDKLAFKKSLETIVNQANL